MSFIGKALGSLTGANQQAKEVGRAADAQVQAAQLGVDESRRQFDALRALLQPFVTSGTGAISAQGDLAGLNGPEAQERAIAAIQSGPQFGALQQQGENSILANASATGGLRGGNVQGALAQFSPRLLSQLIDQQYGRLGGLSSMGQNAAAGVGNAGMQTGTQIAQLLQQQGSAQAGGILGQANIARKSQSDAFGLVSNFLGGLF